MSAQLRDEHGQFTGQYPVHCDQCEMVSINGLACHETGCLNAGKRWDRATDSWIWYVDCAVCGFEVREGDTCCEEV